MANCIEPDVIEMLRTLAVARLILGGEMNIQAPLNLAPKGYGRYLDAGSTRRCVRFAQSAVNHYLLIVVHRST